jgi:Teichoic acid biosynthesis proteins
MEDNIVNFKGIKFYNYDFHKIVSIINEGGYLVAPAASALTNISKDKIYHQSLINSDVAIFDSGFFVILLRIFKKKKVTKFSGYWFLKNFLNLDFPEKVNFLTIDPTKEDGEANTKYLKNKKIINTTSYVAPTYIKEKIIDENLLNEINKIRPRYIIVNLGGGVQELLALYIKKNINFKTSILCTGAAIGFLTKRQAPINDLVDKLYLGWLVRTLHNPKKFFFRTIKSLSLIKQFLKD